MASEINTNNIDTDYPRAGEDNSTQGLRDNFVSITTNIETAKNEINDLQENTARTDGLSNFNGSTIFNAELRAVGQETLNLGIIDQNTELSFANSSHQILTADASITLTFTDWPETGKQGSIWLEIKKGTNLSSPPVISLDTLNNQEIKYDGKWPNPLILTNEERIVVVKLSSSDNGKSIYASYVGAYTDGFDDAEEVRNLLVTQDAAINGNLTVNGTIQFPDLEVPVDLNALTDVSSASPDDKDILRYNSNTEQWEPIYGELVNITVAVLDNQSSGQDEFYFDGSRVGTLDFVWEVGTTYRLDLSDPTNSNAPLRFSTTPDTNVPSSITEYTDRVTIVGTTGEPDSYIEIEITEDTPHPLYLYAEETGLDTSLIGRGEDGALDVGIKRKTAIFDQAKTDLLNSANEKIVDYKTSTVEGNHTPATFIFPNYTTIERDNVLATLGETIYNTTTGKIQSYVADSGDGTTGWVDLH